MTNTSWEATIIHVVDLDRRFRRHPRLRRGPVGLRRVDHQLPRPAERQLVGLRHQPVRHALPRTRTCCPLIAQARSSGVRMAAPRFSVPDAPYTCRTRPVCLTRRGRSAHRRAPHCQDAFRQRALAPSYAPFVVQKLAGAPVRSSATWAAARRSSSRHTGDWLSTLTDNPIFFYVTVDNFQQLRPDASPSDPATSAPTGDYNYENVLIGEIYYMNSTLKYSEATPAVHIESDLDSELATATSEFYYGEVAADPSRPTSSPWAPLSASSTTTMRRPSPPPSSCGRTTGSSTSCLTWDDDVLDCGSYLYYAWDEDEHDITRGVTCPFPRARRRHRPERVPVRDPDGPSDHRQLRPAGCGGWMLLVFPPSYDAGFWVANGDPTPNDILAQP